MLSAETGSLIAIRLAPQWSAQKTVLRAEVYAGH